MFEMDDNQKTLFNALTPLRQKVSLNHIAGMKPAEAHKEANGKCKHEKNRRKLANEILTKPDVKDFIESMANHIVNPAIMSRDEMMKELSLVARTNSNDLIEWGYRDVKTINKDSGEEEIVPQSYWTLKPVDEIKPEHMGAIEEVSVGKEGLKFKRTPKLSAMKQLAELAGYNAASKHDHSSKDGTMSPTGKSLDDFYADSE